MKQSLAASIAIPVSLSALAQTVTFDRDPIGVPPAGWQCGVTGTGSPHWAVAAGSGETDGHNVLMQSGAGTFPWCVVSGIAVDDGFVEVRFKPISGREDQAGGLVWRWKDGDHYYVARANALENNVSLYYTEGGRRKTLKYVDAPVASGSWHRLRVDFAGSRIAVSLDGTQAIEFDDRHIGGAGTVGVWTKADSVTAFYDFKYGAPRP